MNSTESHANICLFTDTAGDANGVSRFIQDIAREADKRNFGFYVITSTLKERFDYKSNIINFKPAARFPMPFYPELDLVMPAYFKFKRKVKEIKPNLIHVATPGPVGFCGMRIAAELNIPKAGVYHTNFPAYIRDNTKNKMAENITTRFMRRFYKNFSKVFARSDEYIEILKHDIQIPDDRLHRILPGTNVTKFHRGFRDTDMWKNYEGVDKDAVKALYVGRLSKEKNLPFLLEAWEKYTQNRPENAPRSQLICIGEGKYLEEKEAWLQKGVVFLGYRGGEELSKLYASCDFFLFPSLTDTLGQVVMEAQSSGLPVVVTDVGGPQTVINLDGQSGFVVPTDDLAKWSAIIEKLVSDHALRAELGENGFQSIQKLSIENSFEDFWKANESIALQQHLI